MSNNTLPMTIIGGGIGGLAAALGAADAGHKVAVLEQAPEFGEIGAGIQLAPNAMAILDRFNLLGELDKYAVYPQRLVLKDAYTGEELSALDLGDAFKERYGYSYTVMHRTDLHKVLLEACERNDDITLLTNHMITDIQRGPDSVTISCDNGKTYEADSLIGADGLWSESRKQIIDDEAICSEYVAYRGAIPMEEISEHADFDDVIMWIGPHLHLVQYPIRRKELYNQVAVFRSFNYTKEIEHTDQWGTPEELDEHFGRCVPEVQNAVTFMQRQRRWPLYDREPLEKWAEGNFTLLGDSAHPMLQYLAQGACQALEDADSLTNQLKENNSVEDAFQAYQQERVARANKVQKTARTWGDILHTDNDIATLTRDAYMKERDAQDFEIVDWLYGHFVNSTDKTTVNK
ncbi:salicylate hydroxylase [Alteribacillus persepolensis]|uniref:Salicylate hydroxylase n=1 Tax=Alteribacillus persepolensis TaxID=568899 RepID=A0A1G8A6R5_9BACI|nr:FAD-dependent monooxygenase [Alteribacillus persepolensis]SDH16629.1 salicylate hydroxylase [Alteribacillus persepolensis]